MDEFNCSLFFCQELLGPFIGQVYIMAKDNYVDPSKKLVKFLESLSRKNNLLFAGINLDGIVNENQEIIVSEEEKDNPHVLLHEQFHFEMNKRFLGDPSKFLFLEESFAEAYGITKLKSEEEQEISIKFSADFRKQFNTLFTLKPGENLGSLIENIFKEYSTVVKQKPLSFVKSDSYPLFLLMLKYNAYLDLGIRFMRKHGIEKTLEILPMAVAAVEIKKDNRTYVDCLNHYLSKEEQVEDPLKMPVLMKQGECVFHLATENLYCCFDIDPKFKLQGKNASKMFNILLSELVKEEKIKRLWPRELNKTYSNSKESYELSKKLYDQLS